MSNKSSKYRLIAIALSIIGLLCSPGVSSFPMAGVDNTTSLGKFGIRLNQAMGQQLLGIPDCPFGNSACFIESPVLFDGETTIGRSDPHTDGDPTDEITGALVCQTGAPCTTFFPQTVKDSDFPWVPNTGVFTEGPAGTDEIHTQINSFNMIDLGRDCGGILSKNAIRAGSAAHDPLPRSLGEVESLDPSNDFPAESFFDIFVEVDLDFPPFGNIDMTVFNTTPLVIQNGKLEKLPPRVVYIHGGSDTAPAVFQKGTNRHIGWITLAGHGVSYGCPDVNEFIQVYEEMPEQTKLEPPPIWPGFDLFETLPGTKIDFREVGGPIVPLTGNPALLASENIGPTDTIVKRQQGINPFDPGDVGTVEIELVALSLQSIAPFDVGFLELSPPFPAGTMADLYVTINALDIPNIPVPDALEPSTGTMTISHENQENAPIQGTFKSELKVNSGLIFVRAGGSLSDPDAWLFHMPDPTAPLLLNSDGIWSHTPPVGDVHNAKYPAGIYIREIKHESPRHIHRVKPVRVRAIGPGTTSDLIIDFGPGIQAWLNNNTWQSIHSLSADSMETGDLDANGQDELIIDFGTQYGIWILMNNSNWVHLHGLSPESMVIGDLDGNGQDDLIIDFGAPGIWIWMNNSKWVHLHSLSPESMVIGDLDGNGQDELIIDFGPNGIWSWMNNSNWVKLHSLSPESMVTGDLDGNGLDDLIINFGPASGIWIRMNNNTWVHLHSLSPQGMATGDLDGNGQDELIIDFGLPFGIWMWMNNSNWVPLSGSADSSCQTADLDSNGQDDAIFSFGTFGIWAWMNNSGWSKLHNDPAKSMVSGNLDGGQPPSPAAAQSMTHELPVALENTAILPKP